MRYGGNRGGHHRKGGKKGGLAAALQTSFRDSGQAWKSHGAARTAAGSGPSAGKKRRRESIEALRNATHDDGSESDTRALSDIEDDTLKKGYAAPLRPVPRGLDADDKTIQRLERKLGLGKAAEASSRGTATAAEQLRLKQVAKLNREFAGDGFGDSFGEFLVGLDDVGGDGVGDADSSDDDVKDLSSDGDDDSTDGAGDAIASRVSNPSGAGPASASVSGSVTAVQSYVPPHLRRATSSLSRGTPAAAAAGSVPAQRDLYGRDAPDVVKPGSLEHVDADALRPSDARVRIRKRMQGLVNRLSESNIEPVSKELEGVYETEAQVGRRSVVRVGM